MFELIKSATKLIATSQGYLHIVHIYGSYYAVTSESR